MSDKRKFNEMNEQELKKISGGGTEEVQTLNESDLEQVAGGTVYNRVQFRCPVCGYKMYLPNTGCEIGEEGPVCTKCTYASGQRVRMIRIT